MHWMGTGKHTVFGRVSSGMEIIKRMSLVQTDSNDRCVAWLLFHCRGLTRGTGGDGWMGVGQAKGADSDYGDECERVRDGERQKER